MFCHPHENSCSWRGEDRVYASWYPYRELRAQILHKYLVNLCYLWGYMGSGMKVLGSWVSKGVWPRECQLLGFICSLALLGILHTLAVVCFGDTGFELLRMAWFCTFVGPLELYCMYHLFLIIAVLLMPLSKQVEQGIPVMCIHKGHWIGTQKSGWFITKNPRLWEVSSRGTQTSGYHA